MRLSLLSITSFFVVFSLLSCDVNSIGPYYNLGKFTNRTIAERKTLAYLADIYDKLPSDGYKKVKYNFEPSKPNTGTEHAIWYSKTAGELMFEYDLGSGTCSAWTGINQAVLNQIVQANKGLSTADSLGKSNGVSYLDCVGN